MEEFFLGRDPATPWVQSRSCSPRRNHASSPVHRSGQLGADPQRGGSPPPVPCRQWLTPVCGSSPSPLGQEGRTDVWLQLGRMRPKSPRWWKMSPAHLPSYLWLEGFTSSKGLFQSNRKIAAEFSCRYFPAEKEPAQQI